LTPWKLITKFSGYPTGNDLESLTLLLQNILLKRNNERPLKAAIEEFLKLYRLDDKLNETRLIHCWEQVVGDMVAKHTLKLSVKNKKLFVKIDSSPLRNELMYMRDKIVKELNKEVGSVVIDEVVFN